MQAAERPVQPREPRRDCEVPEPRAAKRRLEQVLGYDPGPLTTRESIAARSAGRARPSAFQDTPRVKVEAHFGLFRAYETEAAQRCG
jgi:hypothetical protein